jgi:hypothetical protein
MSVEVSTRADRSPPEFKNTWDVRLTHQFAFINNVTGNSKDCLIEVTFILVTKV